ncbi:hypothetical protein [Chitinophaga eiseniae]|nr:hypothetical protein [Chitinophaga eiseniae]
MASLYTVMFEVPGGATTKLDQFIGKYRDAYPEQLMDIVRRLKSLGTKTGCIENFFKLDEGLDPDDLVCALYDVPETNLRLYCIRLSDQIAILGDGGPKPKTIRAWQEDKDLEREVHEMMRVSKIIRTKIDNGDLRISDNGLRLEGDLWITRPLTY